jgi:transcriptional regulator with XRE-family HTH domain
MTTVEQIGPRLRAARRARGWTLDDLAARAGMSASTLSRLESGKRQASLELLVPLVRQLGIRLDDLVPDDRADPRVRRPVQRRAGMTVAPLTLERAPVQAFKVTYSASAVPPAEPGVHDGYEWLYVLSGRVRIVLDGVEHLLEPGEAAEFDTRVPHSISGDGVAAEIVSIFSAAGERIHTRVGDDG